MVGSKWKRRKCHARSKASLYCDGCDTYSTKCPMRDKYRLLRHTNYGKEKYHPEDPYELA